MLGARAKQSRDAAAPRDGDGAEPPGAAARSGTRCRCCTAALRTASGWGQVEGPPAAPPDIPAHQNTATHRGLSPTWHGQDEKQTPALTDARIGARREPGPRVTYIEKTPKSPRAA